MKKRVHRTSSEPSSRVIGTMRIRELERKIRKPSVRPGQRIKSKKAYNRSARKKEDTTLSREA